jgi:hypothetical protein
MADAVYTFPANPQPEHMQRILVQLRLDADFMALIDQWRATRDITRTRAVYELLRIGMADQMLRAARRKKGR